jgi:hypothetical protein
MNNPVISAEIVNHKGQYITTTDSLGRFNFTGTIGNKYGAEKSGYGLKWFIARGGAEEQVIVLPLKIQDVESVIITRKGSEEALDLRNVNIIDYQPLQGYILTLKKKKGVYYVGIDSLKTEGLSIPINIWKPHSLYFDCMENTFIVSEDSAFQFVILDGEMEYISQMSLLSFNTYISPCVADFDSTLVLSKLSDHNKRYDLTKYQNGVAETFFTRMDSIGYQVASEEALMLGILNNNELVGDSLDDSVLERRRKMREIHNGENPDINLQMLEQSQKAELLDRGEPMSQQERTNLEQQMSHSSYDNSGSGWGQSQAMYQLRSQPVKLQSFQIADYIATVDFDSDSVILFNHKGTRIQSKTFSVPCEVKEVWQDLSNGYLFLYAKDRGNHKVYSLNALTGEVQYLKNFKGASHTESGLIYDNWLYYRTIENGFYGINRVQLPEQNF